MPETIHNVQIDGLTKVELNHKCAEVVVKNWTDSFIYIKFNEDDENHIKVAENMGATIVGNKYMAETLGANTSIEELWIDGYGEVEIIETSYKY